MVEALDMPATVSRRYGKIARMYDWFTDYELVQHELAAGLAELGPRDRVLDVACGTGRGLLALSGRLDPDVPRHGLDLTPAMLARARRKLADQGLGEVCKLEIGNAAQLPYPDGGFDLVYNGYFFDLVILDAMGDNRDRAVQLKCSSIVGSWGFNFRNPFTHADMRLQPLPR